MESDGSRQDGRLPGIERPEGLEDGVGVERPKGLEQALWGAIPAIEHLFHCGPGFNP